jgi:hypothetical protein
MRLDMDVPLGFCLEQALPPGGNGSQLERGSAESELMPLRNNFCDNFP